MSERRISRHSAHRGRGHRMIVGRTTSDGALPRTAASNAFIPESLPRPGSRPRTLVILDPPPPLL